MIAWELVRQDLGTLTDDFLATGWSGPGSFPCDNLDILTGDNMGLEWRGPDNCIWL